MSNVIYPKYKEALLSGSTNIDLIGGVNAVKVALVDTGTYTYNAAHQFLSTLSGVVSTAQPIAGTRTVTDGKFTTNNLSVTFTAVTGNTVEAIVIYIDTGLASSSRLVAYFDSVSGLQLTPNGGNVTVTFSGSGIFDL